jgi:RNA polymerase-binding protein DksA
VKGARRKIWRKMTMAKKRKKRVKRAPRRRAKKAVKRAGRAVKRAKPGKARNIKRLPRKELEKFKALLLKEKSNLDTELNIRSETIKKTQKDSAGDLSGYTFHMADVASDTYDRDFSVGLATEEQKLLYAIDEALKRVRDGTFGYCVECGKKISKERLLAVPHADLCIECQKSKEIPR